MINSIDLAQDTRQIRDICSALNYHADGDDKVVSLMAYYLHCIADRIDEGLVAAVEEFELEQKEETTNLALRKIFGPAGNPVEGLNDLNREHPSLFDHARKCLIEGSKICAIKSVRHSVPLFAGTRFTADSGRSISLRDAKYFIDTLK